VDGTTYASADPGGSASASFKISPYYPSLNSDINFGSNEAIHGLYSFIVPLNGGYGGWGLTIYAEARANLGFASADVSHTVILSSVTLNDGNTPESEGYNLRFGSGLVSPNLGAVPEPSSYVLLMSGLVGVSMTFCRRSRRAKAA
jgi:hypothetical protein